MGTELITRIMKLNLPEVLVRLTAGFEVGEAKAPERSPEGVIRPTEGK